MQPSSVIQVKFVANGNDVKGEHPSFSKIGFVSRNYNSSARFKKSPRPQDGEEWICKVVRDTQPDNPRRGAIILWPLHRVAEYVTWEVSGATETGVTVTRRRSFGQREIASDQFVIATASALVDFNPLETTVLPPHVRRQVREKFDDREYALSDCQVAMESHDSKPVITVSLMEEDGKGGRIRRKYTLDSAAEVRSNWPERLKAQVEHEFFMIGVRARAAQEALKREEEARARQAAEAARKAALTTRQAIIERLAGKTIVSIAKLEDSEHPVTMQTYRGPSKEILVDGVSVGLRSLVDDLRLITFPLTIKTRRITFSNGTVITLASKRLHARKWLSEDDSVKTSGWRPYRSESDAIFADSQALNLFGKQTLSWREAQALSIGDVIGYEYPFQWAHNFLTNGLVWFPRTRPERSAWRDYPVSAVPVEGWELFLSGLEGRFAGDLLGWHKQVTTRPKRAVREHPLTERQKEIAAVVQGQMWSGSKDCKRVGFGRNLVFHVPAPSGQMIYVVDNPGVGAIYIFRELQDATDFASGLMTRAQARAKGHKYIIHSKGWENRLAAFISAA